MILTGCSAWLHVCLNLQKKKTNEKSTATTLAIISDLPQTVVATLPLAVGFDPFMFDNNKTQGIFQEYV